MKKILLVDDKEENLYYLRTLLSAHGYGVETAIHGAEALVRARRTPPDMIISDLLMPIMDGYTLLRRWRSQESLAKIPFIVYTATYTEPEDEGLALDLGADAFFLKPMDPDVFIERIKKFLVPGHVALHSATTEATTEPQTETQTQTETSIQPPRHDQVMRSYSGSLIRKLEDKTIQLEQANLRLKQDIEAREVAERALRESEARFRQLAENIDDIFWLSDTSGSELYYLSPAFETVYGRKLAETLTTPPLCFDFIHPEDKERIDASLAGFREGNWDETYRIVRPDGDVRTLRGRAFPVRNSDGHIYRIAGVARDITDYRRLEEQFRQAQKMEAIGRLAGGVAHDFNNLLSVILSYTSIVIDELPTTNPLRDDIVQVRAAGERAAALTRQLLAFSRQQVLQPSVLDIARVVRDLERMLRRILREDIQLRICTAGSPGFVFADPSQIEQVVMNLAVNARDAMPRGGTLDIEVHGLDSSRVVGPHQLEAGQWVMLRVKDTGTGMDRGTQDRIFEPFFTTKAEGKGTGLGLSTVFGIIKQNDGHIEVESQVGEGSTFTLYLPCTRRAPDEEHRLRGQRRNVGGTETILLVEDDAQVRAMTRAVLIRAGYTVYDAADGADAIDMADSMTAPIDIVLTDVVMPNKGGREVVEYLARTHPRIRAIYISGYTEDSILHHGIESKDIAFLHKPITPDVLLRTIRDVLDGTLPTPVARANSK